VKKNEVKNFVKQYKNTVCLNQDLKFVKVVDCLEEESKASCIVLSEDGTRKTLPASDKIIPLKGRLKERDYNHVEAQFNKLVK
jgi:hypothetical protein